jgi:hypothetical protein
MDVKPTENDGQLRVTDSAGPKPLSKVYARLADGSVKFHKDGSTDVRGRFNYASVSTPERSRSSGSRSWSSATTAAPSDARHHPHISDAVVIDTPDGSTLVMIGRGIRLLKASQYSSAGGI